MAGEEDVYSLVIDVDATPVQKAEQVVEQAEAEIYKFAKTVQVSTDQVSHGFTHASEEIYAFAEAEKRASGPTIQIAQAAQVSAKSMHALGDGHDRAAKSGGNLGRSMLETGRIIQDFAQGGIPGILNNLEGFSSALGLGAGVAGAATALGVAFFLLGPKIKEALGGLSDASEQIDVTKSSLVALTEKIDQLKEHPIELAVDMLELEEAEKRLKKLQDGIAAYNRMSLLRTDWQQKSGQAVENAVRNVDGGADKLKNQIRAQVTAERMENDKRVAQLREDYEQGRQLLEIASNANQRFFARDLMEKAKTQMQALRLTMENESEAYVGDLYNEASSGTNDAKRKELADRTRRAGHREAATRIENAGPEQMRQEAEQHQRNENLAALQREETENKAREDEKKAARERSEAAKRRGNRERVAAEQREDRAEQKGMRAVDPNVAAMPGHAPVAVPGKPGQGGENRGGEGAAPKGKAGGPGEVPGAPEGAPGEDGGNRARPRRLSPSDQRIMRAQRLRKEREAKARQENISRGRQRGRRNPGGLPSITDPLALPGASSPGPAALAEHNRRSVQGLPPTIPRAADAQEAARRAALGQPKPVQPLPPGFGKPKPVDPAEQQRIQNLGRQGLNTTGQLLQTASALNSEVGQLERSQRALAQQVAQLNTQVRQRQRTYLSQGSIA